MTDPKATPPPKEPYLAEVRRDAEEEATDGPGTTPPRRWDPSPSRYSR